MRLYLIWIIGIAILLMVDDATVRTLAALVLVVGAWPLWRTMQSTLTATTYRQAAALLDQTRYRQPSDEDDPQPSQAPLD